MSINYTSSSYLSDAITSGITKVRTGESKYATLPYYIVDAFAQEPYKGNPATVVLCDKLIEHYLTEEHKKKAIHTCQSVTDINTQAAVIDRYSNLIPLQVLRCITHEVCSVEVAFVIPLPALPQETIPETTTTNNSNSSSSDSNNNNINLLAYDKNINTTTTTNNNNKNVPFYVVRFFTKTGEMPFCGHASFAAAHIIFNVLTNYNVSTDNLCRHKSTMKNNNKSPEEIKFVTKGNGVVQLRKCQVSNLAITNKTSTILPFSTTAIIANTNNNEVKDNTKKEHTKSTSHISMLLNAGNITTTPSTTQLLSQIKEGAPSTINLLYSLGLVHENCHAREQNVSNINNNIINDISTGTHKLSKAQIALRTATLIDSIAYEVKTGNLIFILHNATSVLQANPPSHELVQSLQSVSSSNTNTNNKHERKEDVYYFNGKITRITLMARPTSEERSSRVIASTHMDISKTNNKPTISVPQLIDVSEVDFVLRLFAPWINISEDALSANTQCALAKYWAEQLHVPCGTPLTSYQGSARGQALKLIIEKGEGSDNAVNMKKNKVRVEGTCVVIAHGIVTSPVLTSVTEIKSSL